MTTAVKGGEGKPFCRLVLIPLDTREFHYLRWEPASEEQTLLAVSEKYNDQRPQKFNACVQYKDPLFPEPAAGIKLPAWPENAHGIESPVEGDDSFVRKMCERLATVGATDDPEIKLSALGIRQRLYQLRSMQYEPTPNHERYGRLVSECSRYWREIVLRRDVMPTALYGQVMKQGRKPGTVGPIRKAIKRILKRHPSYSPLDIWNSFFHNPPKGWTITHDRNGRRIKAPNAGNGMAYRRFCNIVSDEKGRLKKR